ncbi:MAG: hypothetical protein EOP48_21145 [Sphingobacteriales bacterium]|nr:MAG: hypothetical protein EOP48_21145 [Sphingobacteriales bacterium]
MSINEERYSFYNGFPGDSLIGVLAKDQTNLLLVFEGEGRVVNESEDASASAFSYCHKEDTEEVCNYGREKYRVSCLLCG